MKFFPVYFFHNCHAKYLGTEKRIVKTIVQIDLSCGRKCPYTYFINFSIKFLFVSRNNSHVNNNILQVKRYMSAAKSVTCIFN